MITNKTNLKIFCNWCSIDTNHVIIKEHKINQFHTNKKDGKKSLLVTYSYQIIQCAGCDSISFRSLTFAPKSLERNSDGELVIIDNRSIEEIYPERRNNLMHEKKIFGIPFLIRKAYKEVVENYNLGNYILCSAGLRAIVEGICNHFSIKPKYLKDRIEDLSKVGLISNELAESLKIHKFLGDKALHTLEIADSEELKASIQLLELTLETVFEAPTRHKKLREVLTKRVANK